MVRPTYDDEDECSSNEEIAEAHMDKNTENVMNDGISRNFEDVDLDEFDSALMEISITPNDSLRYQFGGAVRDPILMPSRIRPSTSPESL